MLAKALTGIGSGGSSTIGQYVSKQITRRKDSIACAAVFGGLEGSLPTVGSTTTEISYLAMAGLCGFIFASTAFLTPFLGSYLYPNTLQWLEAKGTHLGPVSRWILAGLLWVTPGLIVFIVFNVILAVMRSILPLPETPLSKQAIAWGMGAGLITGVVVDRYVTRRELRK